MLISVDFVVTFTNMLSYFTMESIPSSLVTFISSMLSSALHCLINRWRFVVHGGIDGHSRLITYLKVDTNNN